MVARRWLLVVLLLVVAAPAFGAGTVFDVGSGYDVLRGLFRYRPRFSIGLTGHCRVVPTEMCDANNGVTGTIHACATAADVCEPVLMQWESGFGLPVAWIDGYGAFYSQQNATSQRAVIFGALNATLIGASTDNNGTGRLSFTQAPKANQLDCGNASLVFTPRANGGTTGGNAVIGTNLNACTQAEQNAQLAVINDLATDRVLYLKAATGQTQRILQIDSDDGQILTVNGDQVTQFNQPVLGRAVTRTTTVSGAGDPPRREVFQYRASTQSGNTQTNIGQVTIAANTSTVVECTIVARQTVAGGGGSVNDAGVYVRRALFDGAGVRVNIIPVGGDLESASIASAWDATITAAGLVQATHPSTGTVVWTAYCNATYTGS